MSKRISKSAIDWKALEKRVPPDQKPHFFAFKAKAEGYFRRVVANPPEPPKIDWAYYKKFVPIPGLVDKFQKEYEGLKVPYPVDTLSVKIDEQWKKLEVEIKNFKAEQQNNIVVAQKELDRIRALPKFEDMTMEMFATVYPEQAFDPVNKPSFWPNDGEEKPNYLEEHNKSK